MSCYRDCTSWVTYENNFPKFIQASDLANNRPSIYFIFRYRYFTIGAYYISFIPF